MYEKHKPPKITRENCIFTFFFLFPKDPSLVLLSKRKQIELWSKTNDDRAEKSMTQQKFDVMGSNWKGLVFINNEWEAKRANHFKLSVT